MAARNENRQYKVVKIVMCGPTPQSAGYINHMVIVGPNNGLILFDKSDSEKVIKRIFGQGLNVYTLANCAQNFAQMLNVNLSIIPYIKPSNVNYTMVAKQYNARKASADAVQFAGDYLKSWVETKKITG